MRSRGVAGEMDHNRGVDADDRFYEKAVALVRGIPRIAVSAPRTLHKLSFVAATA